MLGRAGRGLLIFAGFPFTGVSWFMSLDSLSTPTLSGLVLEGIKVRLDSGDIAAGLLSSAKAAVYFSISE